MPATPIGRREIETTGEVVPRGVLGDELLVQALVDHYDNAVPWERMEHTARQQDVPLSANTLASSVGALIDRFEPVVELIKDKALGRSLGDGRRDAPHVPAGYRGVHAGRKRRCRLSYRPSMVRETARSSHGSSPAPRVACRRSTRSRPPLHHFANAAVKEAWEPRSSTGRRTSARSSSS